MSSKIYVVLALAVLGIAFSSEALAASPASLQKDGIQITSHTTSYELLQQKDKQGNPLCVIIMRSACLVGVDKECDQDGFEVSGMVKHTQCSAPLEDEYTRYQVLPDLKPGVSHKADEDLQACIARQKRSLESVYNSDVSELLKEKLHVSEVKIDLVDNSESQLSSQKAANLSYGLDFHSEPGKLILHIQEIPTLDKDHCKDMSSRYLADQFLDLENVANVASGVAELPKSPAPQAASAQSAAAIDQAPQTLEVGLNADGSEKSAGSSSAEPQHQ